MYCVDRACHNTECVIHSQLHFRQWIYPNILTFDKWFLIDEVRDRILCSLRSLCIDNKYMAYQVVCFINPQSLFCHLLETLLKLSRLRFYIKTDISSPFIWSAISRWLLIHSEHFVNQRAYAMKHPCYIPNTSSTKACVWITRSIKYHMRRGKEIQFMPFVNGWIATNFWFKIFINIFIYWKEKNYISIISEFKQTFHSIQ